MFYYAEINNLYLVTATHALEAASTNPNYIEITQAQYNSGETVGKYYNKLQNTFTILGEYDSMGTPRNMGYHYADDMPLSVKFDNLDYEINEGLANKANIDHTHSANDVTGLATVATSGSYNDLSNKPTIPTVPTSLPANGGNADTVDGKHASEFATASHTHTLDSVSETTNKKIMTSAERTKLSGIAEGANAYTHPTSHPASMITGLSTVATSGNYNDLSNKPTSMAPTAHTHAQSEISGLADALAGKAASSHTHTAAQVGAAASNHNHDSDYVPFDLFGFNTQGGVEYSYGSGSGKNVLTEISNMPQGVHTIYAISGTAGNPETTESYRYFIHKTSATIGWFYAFGADGSIYSNYQSAAGTFKGWRTIHDVKRKPLWSSARYMTAGHTVTPTKKLSQCEHGWMLLWSDYDPDTATVNDTDFCTTMIPNRNWAGNTWNGSSYYCDIPRYSAGTATDSESRIIKVLTVYDNKLVGSDNNNVAPRNDVVLRAVYEF